MKEDICKNISDQLIDSESINSACSNHIKNCQQCAELAETLSVIKKGPSPVSNLVPSEKFIAGISAGLGAKIAGSASASVGTSSSLLTYAAAGLVAAAVTAAVFSMGSGSGMSSKDRISAVDSAVINREVKALEKSISIDNAPVLRFSSPALNVD